MRSEMRLAFCMRSGRYGFVPVATFYERCWSRKSTWVTTRCAAQVSHLAESVLPFVQKVRKRDRGGEVRECCMVEAATMASQACCQRILFHPRPFVNCRSIEPPTIA